jgi:predicted dehydrogenase
MTESTRRDFIKTGVATVGSAALSATSYAAVQGANERINVGIIGPGGMGSNHIRTLNSQKDVRIIHVCDVDRQRLATAAKNAAVEGREPATTSDMRRLLENKDLSAVFIATPDHWHAPASILALDAGKHVYVEKPCSHNIREGRLMIDAARRARKICQVGTQSRSTEMNMTAMRMIQENAIGEVLSVRVWNSQLRRTIGRQKPSKPPEHLIYEDWIGPAPMVPYQSNLLHGIWRWWYAFGTGDMGNDGVHDIDYTRWGLGVETHPIKVSALGGRYYFDDDGEFPDTQQVTFEYAAEDGESKPRLLIYEQRLWSTNNPFNVDSGAEFYGDKGVMFLSRRGKIQVRDESKALVKLAFEPEPQNDVAHVANFCAAIRDGAKLNADAEIGHFSAALCHLGNIATRLGRSLTFDPALEQIVADEEANALVRREYREHWGTPQGG